MRKLWKNYIAAGVLGLFHNCDFGAGDDDNDIDNGDDNFDSDDDDNKVEMLVM